MDKLKKYKKGIIELLTELADLRAVNAPNVKGYVIEDEKNNHYQLIRMGFEGDEFVHYIVLHFSIDKNAKIWAWKNTTDLHLERELEDKGIDLRDIVAGMVSPELREPIRITY